MGKWPEVLGQEALPMSPKVANANTLGFCCGLNHQKSKHKRTYWSLKHFQTSQLSLLLASSYLVTMSLCLIWNTLRKWAHYFLGHYSLCLFLIDFLKGWPGMPTSLCLSMCAFGHCGVQMLKSHTGLGNLASALEPRRTFQAILSIPHASQEKVISS